MKHEKPDGPSGFINISFCWEPPEESQPENWHVWRKSSQRNLRTAYVAKDNSYRRRITDAPTPRGVDCCPTGRPWRW